MLLSDLILIGILILSIVILITMVTSLLLLVPAIPTPKTVVRFMVDRAKLKGDETVYDLGCGDARILIEAKKRHPGIRAIGYELAFGVWLLAKIKALRARLPIRLHLRDFRTANLRDADIIFLYLIPEVLPALRRKLDSELRPGTKVISHGFAFRDKEPVTVERCPLPSWHFFRQRGTVGPRVFVYEW